MAKSWVGIPVAFYYDDATIQDLTMTRLSGQVLVRKMMALGGLPLAPSKAKDLDSRADYLSLVHDVEALEDEGYDSEVPKRRLGHAGADSEAPGDIGLLSDGHIWQDWLWRGKRLDKEAMQRHVAVPRKENTPGEVIGALQGRTRAVCQKRSQGKGGQ